MSNLENLLKTLSTLGCTGVKISFEDEGALYNEVISMRNLTTSAGVGLSVKIGGCEAKRDIIDCKDLQADTIVAPMVESAFSLTKFLKSLECCKFDCKKGFNLETIQAYENLDSLSEQFCKVDFVTVGRVDFVSSLGKDRNYVNSEEMFEYVRNVFLKARECGTQCYLGGAVSIESKDFLRRLMEEDLLDKFETRYIIYDAHKININDLEKLLYWGNVFEVEWLKYIHNRYMMHANKDIDRIRMIEDRIKSNPVE